MKILVTGAAGFIGMHVAQALLARGDEIIGVDNLNSYYDVNLKKARLDNLNSFENFKFHQIDIANVVHTAEFFKKISPECVVHLAAQPGVRHSITHPQDYINANICGFLNILEGCRNVNVRNLVYASSSSVYGNNLKSPFSEDDAVDHPVSLYAASKRANELMAHSYSALYGFPTTGLRFFTVYGPWGRPDMAYFSFTKAILERRTIDIFNGGSLQRDFTYIENIVDYVIRALDSPAKAKDTKNTVPSQVFNVGNGRPVSLIEFINTLEEVLGVKADKNLLPMQLGDVYQTYADPTLLYQHFGESTDTSLKEGLRKFVSWYVNWADQNEEESKASKLELAKSDVGGTSQI
jgi:UDP-glucuronate 4-epimerase